MGLVGICRGASLRCVTRQHRQPPEADRGTFKLPNRDDWPGENPDANHDEALLAEP